MSELQQLLAALNCPNLDLSVDDAVLWIKGRCVQTPPLDLPTQLLMLEERAILEALASSRNVTQAARKLGMRRDCLRYRMMKHGIDNPNPRYRSKKAA